MFKYYKLPTREQQKMMKSETQHFPVVVCSFAAVHHWDHLQLWGMRTCAPRSTSAHTLTCTLPMPWGARIMTNQKDTGSRVHGHPPSSHRQPTLRTHLQTSAEKESWQELETLSWCVWREQVRVSHHPSEHCSCPVTIILYVWIYRIYFIFIASHLIITVRSRENLFWRLHGNFL